MKYNPQKHHRRSIRLKGYDYHNAGAYFVTICTQNRACVLDDPIVKGIINTVWLALPAWFPTIDLDEFVIMPNHIHFVIWLGVGTSLADVQNADVQDRGKPRSYQIPKPEKINTTPALGDVVGAFKSLVFKVYLDWIKIHDPSRQAKFWQRNYYEHIVRNEQELNAIRQYIIDNPKNWRMDRDNIENQRKLPPPETVEEYLQDIEEMLKIKL
jgi:REP element-mobilizing transposase RayT